jgi:nicotinic acid mononucleotide adenylyltransferase
VALARAALEQLPIERLVVLVVANPGHRRVFASAEDRLRLAQAAFEGLSPEIVLDDNAFTVDAVRDGRLGDDALFVVGADEGAAFPGWKEPTRFSAGCGSRSARARAGRRRISRSATATGSSRSSTLAGLVHRCAGAAARGEP